MNKKLFTVLLTFVLLLSLVTPTLAFNYNETEFSLYINGKKTELNAKRIEGTTYIPLKEITKHTDSKLKWDPKNNSIIIENEYVLISIKSNVTTVKINGMEYETNPSPKVIKGTTYVPANFVNSHLGMNIEVDFSHNSIIITGDIINVTNYQKAWESNRYVTDTSNMPDWFKEYKINHIHNEMSYWNWVKTDKEYIDQYKDNLSIQDKEKLFNELIDLYDYYTQIDDKYVTINKIQYYPSTTIGKLDAIGRAIKARFLLLYKPYDYKYPEMLESGLGNGFGVNAVQTNYTDNFENPISDKLMVSILKELSYPNVKVFNNLSILSVPARLTFKDINTELSGTVNNRGMIIQSNSSVGTFYHELGHIWSNLFQDENYETYSKIRNKKLEDYPNDMTNKWGNKMEENFAQDFLHVFYPYGNDIGGGNAFGIPSEKLKEQLKNWMLLKDEENKVDYLTINGERHLIDTIVTFNGVINLEGSSFMDETFTLVKPNWKEEKIKLETTNTNEFNHTITLKEEGIYQLKTQHNIYNILYLKDNKGLTSGNKVNSEWEELYIGNTPNNIKLWVDYYKNFKGLWTIEDNTGIYVVISKGLTNNELISLQNISFTNSEVVFNIQKGQQDIVVVKLSSKYKDKVFKIYGTLSDITSEKLNTNFILETPIQGETIGSSVFMVGKVRTNTGKLYYEIVQNNKLIHSNTIDLTSKYPHWNRFEDMFTIKSYTKGNAKIIFYEDNTKTKRINELNIILK